MHTRLTRRRGAEPTDARALLEHPRDHAPQRFRPIHTTTMRGPRAAWEWRR